MTNLPSRDIPARNLHHVAYRCRDAQQTRWFYEELLGLPLDVALILEDGVPECNSLSPVIHLFFALDDGSFLAFFDDPFHATESDFDHKHAYDVHIAFEVDNEEALNERRKVLEGAGIETITIDHGFVISLYAYDPNGLEIEFTHRTAQYRPILDGARDTVDADMARWQEITQSIKAERFDADHLARKGPIAFGMPILDPV